MLTKLISHEWKDTFKVPALLLTITVLLSAASLVYFSVADQASAGTDLNVRNFVLYIAYILILSGLSMILTIYFAIRFYKNLYTDEGYLMFTLPVSRSQLIWSKLIVSMAWGILSAVLAALMWTMVLSVAGGLVLTAVYLVFADSIIAMFGGTVNEETFRCSQEYFFYITLGIPFYMFGQAMNPIIRADGNPKFAMVSTLAGAVVNIILDPIFIFCFKWGMMGAAVATVIGQVATAALAVWYLLHMKIIKPASGDYALRGNICGQTLTLGITSFLSQISLVAAMAAINNMLRQYGALDPVFGQAQYAQIPMAVVGIVMKFFQIVISIVVGMAAGCIPIVGYNMGAGKKMRVRKLFTMLLAAEALVGAVALILAEGFPRQLIAIFGAANESSYYADFAVKAFRTYLCMMVLACINKACFIFLQAIGKALASTLLSMFREVVFGVGFALLLPVFFGLDGVLYSMPVSDVLTFVISTFIIAKTYKELNTEGVDRV